MARRMDELSQLTCHGKIWPGRQETAHALCMSAHPRGSRRRRNAASRPVAVSSDREGSLRQEDLPRGALRGGGILGKQLPFRRARLVHVCNLRPPRGGSYIVQRK